MKLKKIVFFSFLFSFLYLFGCAWSNSEAQKSYKNKYSFTLQKKLDAWEKWNKEWFYPQFSEIMKIQNEAHLRRVYEVVSAIWWKRHIEKGWEWDKESIPTQRDSLLERISFRLEWLSHDNAMKEMEVQKVIIMESR